MGKQQWTKEQIRSEVQRQTNEIIEIVEDKATVKISNPIGNEVDELGRNWDISVVTNGNGYIGNIRRIIDVLRDKVNLSN